MSNTGLIITDLDNTLYDWVTYFATSFEALLHALESTLNMREEDLIEEFRVLHREYGTSEQPFIMLELPSVKDRFPGLDRSELLTQLEGPVRAFSEARRATLKLYDHVAETLETLDKAGYVFVAHTESSTVNAFYRLQRLGIDHFFRKVYVQSIRWDGHPLPEREAALRPPSGLIRELPKSERKPNPRLLVDICQQEGFEVDRTCYVGDSLVRDMAMAKEAGVLAIWARYGTRYDPALWDLLVRITHWTSEDVEQESRLREESGKVEPDYVLDSFDHLPSVLQLATGTVAM